MTLLQQSYIATLIQIRSHVSPNQHSPGDSLEDFDLPGGGQLGVLLEGDDQLPVLEGALGRVRHRPGRQAEGPGHLAEASLADVAGVRVVHPALLLLGLDGEHVSVHVDADHVLGHAGQLGADGEGVLALGHVAAHPRDERGVAGGSVEVLPEAVQVAEKAEGVGSREEGREAHLLFEGGWVGVSRLYR